MNTQIQKINKTFKKVTRNKNIYEAVLLVENSNGAFSHHNGYGGKDINKPLHTASITKLFTTTCILILKEQDKLLLDDKLSKYLSEELINGLHIYKGKKYSTDLTLFQLLCHTSGLPDAIEEASNKSKKRALYQDEQRSLNESITKTKQLNPHFAPGNGKRAHYSNINFDLLGKVIEIVTDSPLEDVYKQFIFDPLGLKDTYLPIDENDFIPNVYYKNTSFYSPKTIRSIRASGGCISTARELMVFTKAFFKGKLFNVAIFQELEINNKLQVAMSPIQYGAGYMKIPLGGIVTLFMGKGELLGHSGSTGSFAFYYPTSDLFIVGDVNQMANPALPIQLAMRIAMSLRS